MSKQIIYPSLLPCNRSTRRTIHCIAMNGGDFLISYRGYFLIKLQFFESDKFIIQDASTKLKDKDYKELASFELLKTAMEEQFYQRPAPTPPPRHTPAPPPFQISRPIEPAGARGGLFNVTMLRRSSVVENQPYVPPHSPAAPPST